MNAEKFIHFIKNPAHLYQITYTELKSLVLQYPYCQNLRYLLLKKSILENHQELDQNLQLAATFSADRTFLYQQIKDGDSFVSEADSFVLKEDYLELKDLGTGSIENAKPLSTKIEPPEVAEELIIQEPEAQEKEEETIEQVPVSEPLSSIDPFEEIDEDEIIDITEEMEDLFEAELFDLEIVKPPSKEVIPDEKGERDSDDHVIEKEDIEDDAISIEDLIELDTLTPLERLERAKIRRSASKKEEKEKEKNKQEMESKKEIEEEVEDKKSIDLDFEAIDALIEQTKKEVTIEITNKEFLDVTDTDQPKPSPKASFGSWLKQFQHPDEKKETEEETFKIEESKKKSKKKKEAAKKSEKKKKSTSKKKEKSEKKDKSQKGVSDNVPDKPMKVAQRSLEEDNEIASETLASLLVKQQSYKKAIKMYEKLSLIFPEKSGFFAEQIKKLKNLS